MARPKQPPGTDLIYLPVEQLKIHPKNLRLYYPDAEVAEMAASIKAVGGVIQALQIVPTGDTVQVNGEKLPAYFVVDGNMRLSAARTLDNCPPLKCEQLTSSAAEQLLVMAATSHFHYPKDAVSKGKHYQRLVNEEGLTPPEIAALTGLHQSGIYAALKLLEYTDEPVQQLIAEKKLPGDIALHRQLARIPDPAKRMELARRFAARGVSAKTAVQSVRHVLRQYERLADKPDPTPPQLKVVKKKKPAPGNLSPEKIAELANLHLCEGCRLDGLGDKCYTCPGPYEFINDLVDRLPADVAQTEDETAVAA
jgi:hypothetical protein